MLNKIHKRFAKGCENLPCKDDCDVCPYEIEIDERSEIEKAKDERAYHFTGTELAVLVAKADPMKPRIHEDGRCYCSRCGSFVGLHTERDNIETRYCQGCGQRQDFTEFHKEENKEESK